MQPDDRDLYLEPAAPADLRSKNPAVVAEAAAGGISQRQTCAGQAGGSGSGDSPAMESPRRLSARGDVSKCEGVGCDRRESCTRYLRPAHELRQVWAAFYAALPAPCDAFIPVDHA